MSEVTPAQAPPASSESERVKQRLKQEIAARRAAQERAEKLAESLRALKQKAASREKRVQAYVASRTAALQTARDEAISASVAKSNFVATMSHEIRTPINGVIGVLDLLADCEMDSEARKLVETAQTSAELLCALVNDILDFSKIEAGKLQLEVVAFDLRDLVTEVARGFEVAGLSRNVNLTVDMATDIDRWVCGDPTRVRQVLTNLVGNAIKFTSDGTVDITVRRAEPYQSSVHVLFEVNDSGIGIPEEQQADLFEPFTQADGSTTRKFGGSGLGLVICRRLVELMGGRIALESSPNLGTKVWFDTNFAPADANEATYVRMPMGDLRVLLVEADTQAVDLVGTLCARFGMQLRHVTGAAEGLGVFHEAAQYGHPFSAVLFDPSLLGEGVERFVARMSELTPGVTTPLVSLGNVDLQCGNLVAVSRPVERRNLYKALLEALGPEEKQLEKKEPPPPPAATILTGHLLVVEDNVNNQRVIGAMLKKLGVTFEIADNGSEALEMLEPDKFHLILMDMQMPVMNGLDATKSIRGSDMLWQQTIPIVALTANALPQDRQACLDAGMNDYLSKPVRRRALGELLSKWLPTQDSL